MEAQRKMCSDSAFDGAVPPPGPRRIKVLVVDDVYLICKQVGELVEADGRLWLVATARDGEEAVKMIEIHRPDVIVLDVFMPRMNGAQVLAWIRDRELDIKVLVLTAGPDPRLHEILMLAPDSLLYKDVVAEPGQICGEIVDLFAGRDDTTGRQLLRLAAPLAEERPKLRPGELEVLRWAAQGESAKQIAARLGLRPKYVQNKLNAIHRKLDVTSTTGAVAKAYEIGLLPAEGPPPT
jgi:DNA-binding NarL/FixJ family response regulator